MLTRPSNIIAKPLAREHILSSQTCRPVSASSLSTPSQLPSRTTDSLAQCKENFSQASTTAKIFKEFINTMPEWKPMSIQKVYTVYSNSLATELDTRRILLIITNGTKTDTKSGGG